MFQALTSLFKKPELAAGKIEPVAAEPEVQAAPVETQEAEVTTEPRPRKRPAQFKRGYRVPIVKQNVEFTGFKTPQGIGQTAQQSFTEEEKIDLIKMIATYESHAEIDRWLLLKGKAVSARVVVPRYQNSEKWKPLLEKYRAEFNTRVANIPIANKVKRLWNLNAIFDRLIEQELATDNPVEKVSCINLEMKALNQAQQEIEGKVSVEQNNLYVTQFNNMSREEFDKWRLGLAEKIKRYQEVTPEVSVTKESEAVSEGRNGNG